MYDLPEGVLEVTGTVTAKRRREGLDEDSSWHPYTYYISILGREFQVSEGQYNAVWVGEDATLTKGRFAEWQVTRGSSSSAYRLTSFWRSPGQARRWEKAHQKAHEVCAFLQSLGVDAKVLKEEPPATKTEWGSRYEPDTRFDMVALNFRGVGLALNLLSLLWKSHDETERARGYDEPDIWFEIANSPIHWVRYCSLPTAILTVPGDEIVMENIRGCYVQGSYTGPTLPRLWLKSFRVKSFPVFGRVKRVRWDSTGNFQADNELISRIAASVSQDSGLMEGIVLSGIDFRIGTDRYHNSWVIYPRSDYFTRQIWDCCILIANHLLNHLPLRK